VTIGTFSAGRANNVIPDKAELTGTVRTFNPAVRKTMPEILERIVKGIASGYKARAELRYREEVPSLLNDPAMARIAEGAAIKVCGPGGVVRPDPSMGGEDFAVFQERVPGCFLWVGSGNPDKGIVHQWHNPRFNLDEDSLAIGAGVLAQSALDAGEALRR